MPKPCVRTHDEEVCPVCGASEPMVVDGRYKVVSKLGAGSMGVVYLAHDMPLDRKICLKVISPEYANEPGMGDRFKREAQALASVRSDHVVQVYAFGPYGRSFFFAMEYVEGKTLEQIIEEHVAHGAFISASRAISILKQLAIGLSAVHMKGMVHRDVKPSNVVVEEGTGRPVLIDFGIARQREPADGRKRRSTLPGGTPMYMAPEHSMAMPDADKITERLDIYSLGCTAFELLTSRPPFLAQTLRELQHSHSNETAPLISSVRPELKHLDGVIAQMLAKNPKERFQSCEALVRALDAVTPNLPASNTVEAAGRTLAPGVLRVLIIDDDPVFSAVAARAAERALGRDPVSVMRVGSGVEALETFEQTPAHVVLLDLAMPQLDGVETLSMIRMLPHGGQARVIVCSGNVGDEHRWRASVLGVREFLKKPVNVAELARTIRTLAEGAGWWTPPPNGLSDD